MIIKFSDLDFPDPLHAEYKSSTDIFYTEARDRIENIWSKAPITLRNRFINLSGKNHRAYRSLIFELYILEILLMKDFKVDYEYSGKGISTSVDFHALSENEEFLVEVTSTGPSPEELQAQDYSINPEGYLRIRERLKGKLRKIGDDLQMPLIIAICDSNFNFMSNKFENVQALYGAPEMRIEKLTSEASMGFKEGGFWLSNDRRIESVSGVYFSKGQFPGFSDLTEPKMWLNPNGINEFDPKAWPQFTDFFKSDENLYFTNGRLDFEWNKVESIF